MKSLIPKSCNCKDCQKYRRGTNNAYYYARYSIGYAFKDRLSGDPRSNAKKMGLRISRDVTIHRAGSIRREIYMDGTP